MYKYKDTHANFSTDTLLTTTAFGALESTSRFRETKTMMMMMMKERGLTGAFGDGDGGGGGMGCGGMGSTGWGAAIPGRAVRPRPKPPPPRPPPRWPHRTGSAPSRPVPTCSWPKLLTDTKIQRQQTNKQTRSIRERSIRNNASYRLHQYRALHAHLAAPSAVGLETRFIRFFFTGFHLVLSFNLVLPILLGFI